MKFHAVFDKNNQELKWEPSHSINKTSLLLHGGFYNYLQLMEEYDLRNESRTSEEALLRLLSRRGLSALNLINAEYNLAYESGNKLFITRDFFGTKPLYYFNSDEVFEFGESRGLSEELPPRTLLEYDYERDDLTIHEKKELSVTEVISSLDEGVKTYAKELFRSVSSRVYNLNKVGVIDDKSLGSDFLNKMCKDLQVNAELLEVNITKRGVRRELPKIKEITGVNRPVNLTPFYYGCKKVKEEGVKIILSSYGKRLRKEFNVDSINPAPYYRIAEHFNLTVRFPFLDVQLVQCLNRMKPELRRKLFPLIMQELE